MGNATHMPTGHFLPDTNQHEGWCSGDWTLGMVSDKIKVTTLTLTVNLTLTLTLALTLALTLTNLNPNLKPN